MATVAQNSLQDLWWLALLQGILTIIFGIAAVFWPGLTLTVLVYLFGAYVLVWGVGEVAEGIASLLGKKGRNTWWLSLLLGLAGFWLGIYLLQNPNITLQTLILAIGLILMARGILQIIVGFTEQRSLTHGTLLIIAGFIGIVAGIIILMYPTAGGLAFVWVLGLYAIIIGPLIIAAALDMHRASDAFR